MIDPQNFGFAKLVPGFDFLQNLTQGTSAALPQMPDLSHWVAPTLDLDELEKRIQEFKAVQFWLEQNAKALAATIQALEVQKMTLATLKGMNYQMADLAEAMKIKPQPAASARPAPAEAAVPPQATAAAGKASRRAGAKSGAAGAGKAGGTAGAGVVDPMQWWGSLTQQFQQIASQALQDAAQQGAAAASTFGAAAKPAQPAKAAARPRSSGAAKAAARTSSQTSAKTSAKASARSTGRSRRG